MPRCPPLKCRVLRHLVSPTPVQRCVGPARQVRVGEVDDHYLHHGLEPKRKPLRDWQFAFALISPPPIELGRCSPAPKRKLPPPSQRGVRQFRQNTEANEEDWLAWPEPNRLSARGK